MSYAPPPPQGQGGKAAPADSARRSLGVLTIGASTVGGAATVALSSNPSSKDGALGFPKAPVSNPRSPTSTNVTKTTGKSPPHSARRVHANEVPPPTLSTINKCSKPTVLECRNSSVVVGATNTRPCASSLAYPKKRTAAQASSKIEVPVPAQKPAGPLAPAVGAASRSARAGGGPPSSPHGEGEQEPQLLPSEPSVAPSAIAATTAHNFLRKGQRAEQDAQASRLRRSNSEVHFARRSLDGAAAVLGGKTHRMRRSPVPNKYSSSAVGSRLRGSGRSSAHRVRGGEVAAAPAPAAGVGPALSASGVATVGGLGPGGGLLSKTICGAGSISLHPHVPRGGMSDHLRKFVEDRERRAKDRQQSLVRRSSQLSGGAGSSAIGATSSHPAGGVQVGAAPSSSCAGAGAIVQTTLTVSSVPGEQGDKRESEAHDSAAAPGVTSTATAIAGANHANGGVVFHETGRAVECESGSRSSTTNMSAPSSGPQHSDGRPSQTNGPTPSPHLPTSSSFLDCARKKNQHQVQLAPPDIGTSAAPPAEPRPQPAAEEEGVFALSDIGGLRDRLARAREEHKRAKARNSEWERPNLDFAATLKV